MKAADIHQKVRLNNRVSEFSYFAPDQVLTAGQLNQLIQYLDYQDRASRAWLTGSGLICGYTHEFTKNSLVLSAGCALTSDGDLVAIPQEVQLTHVRPFKDVNAGYFGEKGTSRASFRAPDKILELLPTQQAKRESDVKALDPDMLQKRVLVLYLESYAKEPEFCTGDNCDNQGPVQHNNIRILAVPEESVTPLGSDFGDLANQLEPVVVSRPAFHNAITRLEGSEQFQGAITNSIKATRSALLRQLEKVSKVFDSVLKRYGFNEPPSWKEGLQGGNLNPEKEIRGLLYFYGFYRDFARAYREWRESLFSLRPGHCGIRPLAHPKHILLGMAGQEVSCAPTPHRHRFYRAAALSSGGDELERSRLLWLRLIAMLESFTSTPTVVKKRAVSELAGLNNRVRITPCASPDGPLCEHSVPIFFGKKFDPPWNVGSRLQCRFEAPPSYYAKGDDAFRFSLCEKPFYRVEGHLGEDLDEVLVTLKKLRSHHNICFNILTVQIEDDPDKARKMPWRFFDIESHYFAYRSEFKLRLRDIGDYSDRLVDALKGKEDLIPDNEKADDAKVAAGSVRAKASEIKSKLPRHFAQFTTSKVKTFLADYQTAVVQGHRVTRNTYSIAGNQQFSPMERFVQPELPVKFANLRDLLTKRTRKAAEQTTFKKFVEKHPGLEHLGGVAKGGTFILVYSTDSKNRRIVKADLSLPCFCDFDISQLEGEEEPADFDAPILDKEPAKKPPVFRPRLWKDDYNWKVFDVQTPKFRKQLQLLEDDVRVFKGKGSTRGDLEGVPGRTTPRRRRNFGKHRDQVEEAEQIRDRILKTRVAIAEGDDTPDNRTKLITLEEQQAKKLSGIGNKIALSMVAAEKAGKKTNEEDVRALAFLQDASVEIKAPTARSTLSKDLTRTLNAHKTSARVMGGLGGVKSIL